MQTITTRVNEHRVTLAIGKVDFPNGRWESVAGTVYDRAGYVSADLPLVSGYSTPAQYAIERGVFLAANDQGDVDATALGHVNHATLKRRVSYQLREIPKSHAARPNSQRAMAERSRRAHLADRLGVGVGGLADPRMLTWLLNHQIDVA